MAKYILTKKAVDDISVFWDYTANTWSERQADKYYENLINACEEIAEKPNLGKDMLKLALIFSGLKLESMLFFTGLSFRTKSKF